VFFDKGFIVGFAPGARRMPFTALKLGAVQGRVIVIGELQESSRVGSSICADASRAGLIARPTPELAPFWMTQDPRLFQ
jgi:hypothetical protein